MTLDEIRKLCDKLELWKVNRLSVNEDGYSACGPDRDSIDEATGDAAAVASACTLLPKLLAVAEAARVISSGGVIPDLDHLADLDIAVAGLDEP